MATHFEVPRVLMTPEQQFAYSTADWTEWNGRELHLEPWFLASGAAVSGDVVLCINGGREQGRVDLLRKEASGECAWIMLTREEAELILSPLMAGSTANRDATG